MQEELTDSMQFYAEWMNKWKSEPNGPLFLREPTTPW